MRIPKAVYRVQFNPSFGFRAAKEVITYLAELGISDLYASPIFKARKGSLHGYDVVDPNQLNLDLGTASDFDCLIEESKKYSMGWLQDIVPNHMAFDHENLMLMDVLENGPSSDYFGFFDIEWEHPYPSIKGRILAPFLGRFYGESLEDSELKINYGADGFAISYYNLVFPLKVESYAQLLTHQLGRLKKRLGADHPDLIKFLGALYVLKTLPSGEEGGERYDQIKFIKRTLWELYRINQEVKTFIDDNVRLFSGQKGNPESFKLLDELLAEQLFRLSFWKVATEEINYRRFFSINDLISLRLEDNDVFDRTHSMIFNLVEEGKITGLRIDHIDGLHDPTNYLKRLRQKVEKKYVVVEKILDLEEELPSFWPVQGTTGYDFMNSVNGIFCKSENEKQFNRVYSTFTGFKTAYSELVCEKKRLIMGKHMAGDIDNLAHLMKDLSSRYRYGSDVTLYALRRALVEVMAHFSVYRTYISRESSREKDFAYVKMAVEKAIQTNPGHLNELRFIERLLLLDYDDYLSEAEKEYWLRFVMRFQQFTGPLMAKGFEDTTLYVYNRLLSVNEVGGSPNQFGNSLRAFHRFNQNRANLWPHSLNATSTHDTKRGEDVRARINVLSEMPKEWETNLKTWSRINRKKKKQVKKMNVPDRNDEYFLYQTLIGAFPFYEDECPFFVERMNSYIIKAVREAKVHTAWLKPDTDYEEAYLHFLKEILNLSKENPFLQEFIPFQRKVSFYGIFNSLAQTLIKITSPGVPDFYQGTELWDLNLVDPDNRRPVDFKKRKELLLEIGERGRLDILDLISELLSTKEDARIKFFLIHRGLKARKENIQIFQKGTYIPLEVTGKFRDHVIAFARNTGREWAVTVAPRLLTSVVSEDQLPLGREVWQDTEVLLPEDSSPLWENAFTEQLIGGHSSLLISEVLQYFPVALLVSKEDA